MIFVETPSTAFAPSAFGKVAHYLKEHGYLVTHIVTPKLPSVTAIENWMEPVTRSLPLGKAHFFFSSSTAGEWTDAFSKGPLKERTASVTLVSKDPNATLDWKILADRCLDRCIFLAESDFQNAK